MSKQTRRSKHNGIKSYEAPKLQLAVDDDFDQEELDIAAYRALGRVTRAIAYPFIGNELADLSVRELYTLASLPLTEFMDMAGMGEDETWRPIRDTRVLLTMDPGMVQGHSDDAEVLATFKSLESRGLVNLSQSEESFRMVGVKGRRHAVCANVSEKGRELVETMCCNLNKASRMFDEKVVRAGLDQYKPA
jgi:DNA-binding MarR family transcriptional regulator